MSFFPLFRRYRCHIAASIPHSLPLKNHAAISWIRSEQCDPETRAVIDMDLQSLEGYIILTEDPGNVQIRRPHGYLD